MIELNNWCEMTKESVVYYINMSNLAFITNSLSVTYCYCQGLHIKYRNFIFFSPSIRAFKNSFIFELFAEHFQNGMLMKINQSIF